MMIQWQLNIRPNFGSPRFDSKTLKTIQPPESRTQTGSPLPFQLENLETVCQLGFRRRRAGNVIASTLLELLLLTGILSGVLILAPLILSTSNRHLTSDFGSHTDSIFRIGRTNAHNIWMQIGVCKVVGIDLASRKSGVIYHMPNIPITSVQLSQDGDTLMLSHEDREILIFRNNELLMTEPIPEGMTIEAMLSADGKTAVIVFEGRTVRSWDLADPGLKRLEYDLGVFVAYRMSLDPAGKTLIVSSADGQLYSCDAKTGTSLRELATVDPIKSTPVFSNDGRWLAFVSGKALTMIDMQSREIVWKVPVNPIDDFRSVLTFSPDGRLVALAGCLYGIRILDQTTGQTTMTLSSEYCVNNMIFSPSSEILYVCGSNFSSIRVWSLSLGIELEPVEPL